jgi:hypothetical protein
MQLWPEFTRRNVPSEEAYIAGLGEHLRHRAEERIELVTQWMNGNFSRFEGNPDVQETRSRFKQYAETIRAQVILCKMACVSCGQKCIRPQLHEESHNCQTDHKCYKPCDFLDQHDEDVPTCSLPALHSSNLV